MSDGRLSDLYRETVLSHSRHPHHRHAIEGAQARAEGHNPLCGDSVTVYLNLDDGTVREAAFEASGCAISLASASMLTDAVTGRTTAEAKAITQSVLRMLEDGHDDPALGEINALAGVRGYPTRIRCATLPWHTLQSALSADRNTPTEGGKT